MSILLYILTVVVLINCCYYLLFSKFSFGNSSEEKTAFSYPISIIVCAKNEAENLRRHIPLWLEQEYPDFELILINDSSSDTSLEVMEQFAEKDTRIKIVDVQNIEAFWANKKYALTLGIKKAVNKRMVFTDADCKPASKNWLYITASLFSEEKQLILGYGGYQKRKGLLNKLIRFETLRTAIQYFGYAKVGMPYMGVGRNLAYTSNLYYDNNGFMSHVKILSGDDDLFVNETATAKNTAVNSNPEAFTYSIPKKSFTAWLRQKKRHITTAQYYKKSHKFLLGLYYVSNLLFWAVSVASFLTVSWELPTLLVSIRFLFQYIVVGKAAIRLKEKDLIPFIMIFDAFLVFFQMSLFISNRFSKQTHWK